MTGQAPMSVAGLAQAGAARGDGQVRGDDELVSAAHRQTVHHGDHGLAAAPDRGDRAQGVHTGVDQAFLGEFADVTARREGPAGSGQHHDAHVRTHRHLIQQVGEAVELARAERVQGVRSVEGDPGDAVLDRQQDVLVGSRVVVQ